MELIPVQNKPGLNYILYMRMLSCVFSRHHVGVLMDEW